MFLGQLHNHCLPMRRVTAWGRGFWEGGFGKGVWGRGCGEGGVGKGEVMLHKFNVSMVYWLERIFLKFAIISMKMHFPCTQYQK